MINVLARVRDFGSSLFRPDPALAPPQQVHAKYRGHSAIFTVDLESLQRSYGDAVAVYGFTSEHEELGLLSAITTFKKKYAELKGIRVIPTPRTDDGHRWRFGLELPLYDETSVVLLFAQRSDDGKCLRHCAAYIIGDDEDAIALCKLDRFIRFIDIAFDHNWD